MENQMARYYFDIRENGELSMDENGVELPSLDAARTEAQRTLAELMSENMRTARNFEIVIEIRMLPDGTVVEAVASAAMRDLGS